ncbi:hypothetical protein QFC21_001961 [Naganishia friedmannii]|uniref:Uncharacterized protein n=1 Tax=Naganishia friedmannii TaxID=89922 RepID=A0ACC2VZA2_9TREE|nr:hypothetical protein QFC21_001961 [Naganishia friedmannii]
MAPAVPVPIPTLRTTSLVGRKRTRGELESASFGTPPSVPPRRTKSTSDATRLRAADVLRITREGSNESGMETPLSLAPLETPLTGVRDHPAAFLNGSYKRTIMRQFVRNALEKATQGEDAPYQELLAHFSTTSSRSIQAAQPDFPTLLPILQAITSSISLLTPTYHSALVRTLLAIPWAISPDERFVRAYTAWCGVLCSSRAEWVSEVVVMGVKGLRWQQRLPVSADTPTISRALYHIRHQLLFTHLLSLIPTLPTILAPVLVKNFPHKRESEVAMSVYVRNVLDLVEVCPEVAVTVWEVVEIQIELEDMDEDDELAKSFQASTFNDDPLSKLVSESLDLGNDDLDAAMNAAEEEELDIEDIESEEGSVDGYSQHGSEKELDEARYKRLQMLRAKVDALSLHFLRHLERVFVGGSEKNIRRKQLAAYASPVPSRPESPSKQPQQQPTVTFAASTLPPSLPSLPPIHRSFTNAESRLQHFQTLLSLFDRLILPTLHCRRAQFIVFWCCSLSPAYTDLFLGLIVSRALFEQTPAAVSRIAAASYIASFVSRAKYIDDQQTRTVVGYLTAYIDGILDEVRVDPQAVVSSNGLAVFYTVCQALMMIFCFRWKALRSESSRRHSSTGRTAGAAAAAAAGHGGGTDAGPSFADDMEMDDVEDDEETDGHGAAAGRSSDEPEWIPDLKILQKAIHSQLNPLMACFPGVVDMFAKVADLTKFMFCYSIMSANRNALENSASSRPHVRLGNNSANLKGDGNGGRKEAGSGIPHMSEFPLIGRKTLVETDLDQFFPFDPYDLPRSKVYVDKLYRNWDEVALPEMKGDDDEDDDENEEDDEDSSAEEDGNSSGRSLTPNDLSKSNTHHTQRLHMPSGPGGLRTASGRRLPAEELRSAQQISTSLEGMKLSSPPRQPRSFGIVA